MSPGRTFRRHGLPTGSEKSSTTNASLAVEAVTVVVTSCAQRVDGVAVGIGWKVMLSVNGASDIATQNCTGCEWGGTLTANAGSPDPPLAAIDSRVGAAPVPGQTEIDPSFDLYPAMSHNGSAAGPTCTLRTIADRPPAEATVIHSRTSEPRTVYSSTTPPRTRRTAPKRPI